MGDVNDTFGFEIVQTLYDNQIVKKEDVIILFVHWYLIKNGFRCIGLGDSVSREEKYYCNMSRNRSNNFHVVIYLYN